jgi:hypothetical protein
VITLRRFRKLETALRHAGYGDVIDWSEAIDEPTDADEFARRVIYVICNSGMRVTVAGPIFQRCLVELDGGRSATRVFGHPGKGPAIDQIWRDRAAIFQEYRVVGAKLDFLEALPWIGPVTKHHLAKNLGADTAKPDVHLERLARRDGTSVQTLCRRLARQTGYRVATIDTILWRACADGILSSRQYEVAGWTAAFRGQPVLAIDGGRLLTVS